MQVEVIRSTRRHKTVQATVLDGVLRVSIPDGMTAAEEAHWVDVMQRRLERDRTAALIDLEQRAVDLVARYDLPRPHAVDWSNRQHTLWGSTTVASRTIRISTRLSGFPLWVLDYVLVHELAHLREANHSKAFWDLVARYPKSERARGYLIAKSETRD